MKTLRKIASIIIKTIIGIFLLIIAYFVIAIILTLIPVNSDFENKPADYEIYISSNGVHTNIIVPSESKVVDWNSFLNLDANCHYIIFGWGDKEFYMNTPNWSDIKFVTAFNAAFLPTDAVLQVSYYFEKPKISKYTIKINLSKEQLNQLNAYIYDTFILDDLTGAIEIMPNKISYSYLHYYKAKGKYSLLFTCNNWTSKGLKKVGVKNSIWAPFDKSVMFYLR